MSVKRKQGELLTFKNEALNNGLCDTYKKLWDNCRSKKDLINVAIDVNGVEFMADSIAFSWGLSKEYILQEFEGYINGLYQRNKGGYTSEMYVGHNGDISLRSTITLIAGCKSKVIIPPHFVGRVYVCGNSELSIIGNGGVEICTYGDNEININSKESVSVSFKRIKKSKWIKYTAE